MYRSTLRALAIGAFLFAAVPSYAQPARERRNFDNAWRFHLGDVQQGEAPALADKDWRAVDLPHDWSIEGPYSPKNASGTGFLPGGIAWYRKTFTLPASMRGRKISVRFDGVYRDSDVWINGRHLGRRPYGYSTFEYDLTPHVRFGESPNVLAVRVDHSVIADSRWYPGSGIYRHVWLNVTGPVHTASWGTYVTTPVAQEAEALVSIETRVLNESAAEAKVTLITTVVDEAGTEVANAKGEESITRAGERTFAQQVAIERPNLWSPEHPRLYAAVSRVYLNGQLADEQTTPFGIRRLYFSPDKGLILNGQPAKLLGVCIHNDLGALGAAFFEEALERRLKRFKTIGVNAIRASHNPMAPEFYDLCDRLGFLVMDEAFDEWIGGKRKWAEGWNVGVAERRGYHEAFEEWGVRDAQDMVLRDRNHPSIVMWSIGNEIDYPDDPFTHPRGRNGVKPNSLSADLMPGIARRLIAAVKQLDTTRPVTMALADINASNATGVAGMLDVVGYNYLEQFYDRDHQTWPNRVIYGSENSRSLDVWRPVALNDYVAGQFLWTGIDFLGEARRFPSHGSAAGLLDIQGFWKRDAYFRQALWSSQPMVYAAAWGAGADESRMSGWPGNLGRTPLVERWGWTDDPRKNIPVEVYTNCDSVELLLNGRSLGEKPIASHLLPALVWAVPNEAGTVEAVGKRGGSPAARFQLKSIGKPERIELSPDLKTLKSDGRQVSTLEVFVVDHDGNRVPDAAHTIAFEVAGAGRLIAVDNADLTDSSPVQAKQKKAYQGRAVAVVRSGAQPGKITIRATAQGLAAGEAVIMVVSGQTAASNPVPAGKLAPRPLYRDPPFDAPTDPVLCFNAEQKKWFMYYTARRATAADAPGVTWIHGSNIGIAESSDGGATWTYRGVAEISYGKDAHPNDYTYWAPEVIWHEGTYHMYLSFVPGIFTDWNHPREIVHLTSKDGVKWNTVGPVDLKSDRVIDACVIQLPDGTWRMWYKDERKPMALSFADSPDLYKWETKGNAVTDRNGEGPKVIHWKGKYFLIADTWATGMRVWSSDDCLHWKAQEETLLGSHGDVVISGGRAWWFYFGGRRAAVRGRSTAINVVELSVAEGKLIAGDPDQPTYVDLKPVREAEK